MKNTDLEPPGLQGNIPLAQLIPNNRGNRYFYENGHAKWIPRLTLKVHSNLEECYSLWEKFTTNNELFDLWDLNYSWHQGTNYQLLFYTLYENKKPVAVLPLCLDFHEQRYEWFGTDWCENRSFFVEDKKFIQLLIAIAPTPLYLNSLAVYDGIESLEKFGKLKLDDEPRNIKNISGYSSMDGLLKSFQKKDRYNLKHDYNKLLSYGARTEFIETKDLSHFEQMLEMNRLRFDGVRNLHSYVSQFKSSFEYIIKNADTYKFKYAKVYVQNKLAAVDMIITYKNIYCPFTGSNDVWRFSGIGNFMTYVELEDAIKGGFSMVDILQEDHGWKHNYFDKVPVYIFEK